MTLILDGFTRKRRDRSKHGEFVYFICNN